MVISSILNHFYNAHTSAHLLVRRAHQHHDTVFVVFACLIPVLVILSGIFAGLTLGYMSLDETQLNVLATSGNSQQREYAKKIIPVRKNGHLLLVSLLLANMIVNETLPVVSDRVLGGGISAVAVSTVLIVIFSEIIPQSICTRHGLYIGAKCAIPVRILMYALAFVAWPVAKLLETILGPHHGIIYRRGELKELINMHSSVSPHGGDLKLDTVSIIGHTLDLQEKVVCDAMTPISDVFMLPIDARLDYETLRRVCESGHSRVPVYDEVEIAGNKPAKKIVGILLVKQCVLLDPSDATPLRSLPLNKVPSVPLDEPLLGILDRFQEGRSHMAIVSLFSKGRAESVKEAVKTGLTRRFLKNVGLGEDGKHDLERGGRSSPTGEADGDHKASGGKERGSALRLPAGIDIEGREQAMPADAVLDSENADNFLRGVDLEINPLGIITLEDVLEELIGEEILDEFDLTGPQAAARYVPPAAIRSAEEQYHGAHTAITMPAPVLQAPTPVRAGVLQFAKVPSIFARSRSQPGASRSGPEDSTVPEVEDITLHVTSTFETDSTAAPPPISLLSPAAVSVPCSTPRTSTPPSQAPRVTEAILQTQTARRRAQFQAQAVSGGVLPPVGGEMQSPVRIVAKGRFKSSPLAPADKGDTRDWEKEKVAEADLPSEGQKEGL